MPVLAAGRTRAEFLDLFLESKDFDEPVRQVQDTREQGPDPDNRAFPKHQGLFAGFTVWMGETDNPIWRIVDIRWSFPSSEKASAFHQEALEHNSEGFPSVPNSRLVGEECYVFGGTNPIPMADIDMNMTSFYYVFRVHNVVVKLFVAQGPDLPDSTLAADQVSILAERIVRRIRDKAESS